MNFEVLVLSSYDGLNMVIDELSENLAIFQVQLAKEQAEKLVRNCQFQLKVRFVVGGDGPKHVRLEEMREKHSLQDGVEMLGVVPHSRVRSVLVLPYDMVVFAEPNPDDMVRAIEKAILILPSINPEEMDNRMEKLYSWQDVAKKLKLGTTVPRSVPIGVF